MPNWSTNNYSVKAATENVLNFVNEGLKNLGMEPKDNIKDAIESLWNGENEVCMSAFRPIPETFEKYDTTNSKLKRDSLGYEGKPAFKSDEEYETYSKEFDEAVQYQKDTYGVVGWYDYNCYVAFGCKWDMEVKLKSYNIDDANGTTTIFMWGETPWNYPYLWLEFIKHKFDLNVYICAQEEADFYNVYGEINNLNCEWAAKFLSENAPNSDDFDDFDNFLEVYYPFRDQFTEELYSKFLDCVNGTV